MKELPSPTFPLSSFPGVSRALKMPARRPAAFISSALLRVSQAFPAALPAVLARGALHRKHHPAHPHLAVPHQAAPLSTPMVPAVQRESRSEAKQEPAIEVSWAVHQDEVREAQRLRYEVFAGEMGARLNTRIPGHDVDLFDDYCEHLLVRNTTTQEVIGTYRVLTSAQAKRVGGFYSDSEFDLTRLRPLRDGMVELGRSCVHPDYRQGGVIMTLWGELIRFMARNKLDTMFGCASIPLLGNGDSSGAINGDVAASLWRQLRETHLAAIEHHVWPRLPLPVEQFDDTLAVEPPALIKGYLRIGAKVLGAPAWDPDFNCADLPIMLRLGDMPARYRKHFLGQ